MFKISFQSVRFRIFLLYIGILFCTLLFFSVLMYAIFDKALHRKMDSLLDLKTQGVETSIRTYLKTERFKTTGWESFFQMFRQREDHFITIAQFLTDREEKPTAGDFGMTVDIFDSSGKLIASTNKSASAVIIPPPVFKNVFHGLTRYYNFKDSSHFLRVWTGRAIVKPVIEGRQVQYVIQVKASLRPVEKELAGIRKILMILISLTLIIASWASMFVVHMTLRPVDRIVRIIRGVKPDNLNVRVSIPDTNDEITRLSDTFNDLLARLEKSFNAQRQIVQDISHELKTPLTVLRGEMEVALKKEREAEEYRRVLHSGLKEIENIRNIINSLLTLARLDSDKVSLEMKPVDLKVLASSVIENIRVLATSKKIAVEFSPGDPLVINGDAMHLKRLLANLLENAVKYTPASGRVNLEITRNGKKVYLNVKDTGVGITKEELPRIFDRFYSGRRNSGTGDGFGLGLSIVKSIVDVHRGCIDVQSTFGKGTNFHVELPL